jgi:DNA recombination protein RmuC
VLAGKAYWRALADTPEFVVLFVPAESFLSAALEADPVLLEYAAERQVVLATPTTLIALLRTVAYAWTQQTLADKTREIHELGRDLHERLSTMGGHLDRLGRSLAGAVGAYNRAVGSLENRVLVSARRFTDLGVGTDGLAPPAAVTEAPRPLTTAELLDVVADERPELPELEPPAHEAAHDPPVAVRRVAP